MLRLLPSGFLTAIIIMGMLITSPLVVASGTTPSFDLLPAGGFIQPTPRDINNAGIAVGSGAHPGGTRALLWNVREPDVPPQVLVAPSGAQTTAQAINSHGHVAGAVEGDESLSDNRLAAQAALWIDGELVELGTLLDESRSVAFDINDSGKVVGYSIQVGGDSRAFVWDAHNGMVPLGTLGGPTSTAHSINNADQVVGESRTADGFTRATLWDLRTGETIDLGTLGGNQSVAYAINDRGQVVGYGELPGGGTRAFLWDAQGGMVELESLGGTSTAIGINNHGQIIGRASNSVHGFNRAVVWDAGQQIDLLELVSPTEIPILFHIGINDHGEIVGLTGPLNASSMPFVLSIPTPGSGVQVSDLIALVQSFNLRQGIENSLDAKLQNAQRALDAERAGDLSSACGLMGAFSKEVQAQAGKSLTSEQAAQLLALAANITAALGCD